MRMRKSFVFTLLAGIASVLSAVWQPAFAESQTCAAPPCAASLDFQVVIPSFMRIQIGDPVARDQIVFDMSGTPSLVADGSPVTGSGGDLNNGEVTVRVIANGGITTSVRVDVDVTGGNSGIDCVGPGNCTPGGNFIAWDQISVSPGGIACGTAPPILDNGGSGFALYPPLGGGIVNENCSWVYTYLNNDPTPPVDGVYQGTVTYTATISP